jgi:hypothetical protein
MTTTSMNGRLCNQIIRNLAVSLIAEKNNLHVDYCNKELIEKIGIYLFNGEYTYDNTIILDDNNYFNIYNCDKIISNLNPNDSFLQTKDIIHLLYNYLHTDKIQQNIIYKNSFNNRYNNNNDLCIHIRLTDVEKYNPGLDYYMKTIKMVDYNNLYITTDDKSHNIIQTIIQYYPNTIIIEFDEIKTIQFASTCKNIILSHGTFSSVIGYLSFYSTIYYPEYEKDKLWHGDLFSINNWIKCCVK